MMKKFLFVFCLILFFEKVPAQIISTVAGGGNLGDGGPAISASMTITNVTFDSIGNMFFADTYNNRIRKITASTGIITTIAGNGQKGFSGDSGLATLAKLNNPDAVALDRFGDIYVCDTYNKRIRKIEISTGIIKTIAGNDTAGFSGDWGDARLAKLNSPMGLIIDKQGNLLFADRNNDRIRKISTQTNVISTVAGDGNRDFSGDGGPAISSSLYYPSNLNLDSAGNIFLTDTYNNKIRKVDISTGIITSIYPNTTISNPVGVAIDKKGNVFYYDNYNHYLNFIDVKTGESSIVTSNIFCRGLTINKDGDLYIANGGRLLKIPANTGTVFTVAGNGSRSFSGDGASATKADLGSPGSIAVDKKGNIFIIDNGRIRKIDKSSGNISTFAGGGVDYTSEGVLATLAGLNNPNGVAVDTFGNVYFADSYSNRVRKVNAKTGKIYTVAGTDVGGYNRDSILATNAKLNYPLGVDVDDSGNVYIADNGNHRIRKVSIINGFISTVAGNGYNNFSGDGGLATAASLNSPRDVKVDDLGNFYIADAVNNRIRKVNSSRIISTIVGNDTSGYSGDSGYAINAKINYPISIDLDKDMNLYIADYSSNRIRKVSLTSGVITTVAGNGIGGYGGENANALLSSINKPLGVAAYDKKLFISDTGNDRIRKVIFYIENNNISNSQIICAGTNPDTLQGSIPMGATGIFNYTWQQSTTNDKSGFLNIVSSNAKNYKPNSLSLDTWYRRITFSGAISDTSNSILIAVKPNPIKPLVSALSNNLLQSSEAYSYQWYLNDIIIPTAIYQYLTFNTNGSYTVKIDSTNDCSSLSNPFVASKVSESELFDENTVTICPNPASNDLFIKSSSSYKLSVQFYDIIGNEASEQVSFTGSTHINTQCFSEGIYFARILLGNAVEIRKIIIVR